LKYRSFSGHQGRRNTLALPARIAIALLGGNSPAYTEPTNPGDQVSDKHGCRFHILLSHDIEENEVLQLKVSDLEEAHNTLASAADEIELDVGNLTAELS